MDPSESSEEGDAVTLVRVYSGFRKKKKSNLTSCRSDAVLGLPHVWKWTRTRQPRGSLRGRGQHLAEGVIADVYQPIANQLPFVTSSDQLLFA